MSIAYQDARATLFKVLTDAWTAQAQAIVGGAYVPAMRVPGDIHTQSMDVRQIYAKAQYQEISSPQSSFRNGNGVRKYTATGMLGVQVLCPVNIPGAYEYGILLARLVQTAFRQAPADSPVWYYNQRIIEQGTINNNNQINVYVTCSYETEE